MEYLDRTGLAYLIEKTQSSINSKATKLDLMGLSVEVAILKGASLNNMTYNVFVENLNSLDGVEASSGIYDEVGKRLYV